MELTPTENEAKTKIDKTAYPESKPIYLELRLPQVKYLIHVPKSKNNVTYKQRSHALYK